jgi:hypothetical protein
MTTTINAGNGTMDFSQAAYKVAAVTESINTPEAAKKLTGSAFSGMRIVLEEVAAFLLNQEGAAEFSHDRSGYKLLIAVALLDTVERAAELGHDTWSGVRIILEEVTAALFDGDSVAA